MQMKKTWWILLISLCGLGCGTIDPSATDTETDTTPVLDGGEDGGLDTDSDNGAVDDYYPMAVGDFWTYRETEGARETEFTYEVTGRETIDFGRETGERTVFVVENTTATTTVVTDEGRTQYIEDEGDRSVRHRQEIYDAAGVFTKQRDFFPGFLRFDRTKTAKGAKWVETFTRVSDPKDGTVPVEETVSYDYEILSTDAPVDIGSKTYHCLEVKRTALSDGETKYYWYAKGIGKVQELTGNTKMEQLIDSSYF